MVGWRRPGRWPHRSRSDNRHCSTRHPRAAGEHSNRRANFSTKTPTTGASLNSGCGRAFSVLRQRPRASPSLGHLLSRKREGDLMTSFHRRLLVSYLVGLEGWGRLGYSLADMRGKCESVYSLLRQPALDHFTSLPV